MCLGSIILIYEGVYGFGVGPTGFIYACQAIGAVIGLLANMFYFERLFHKNSARKGPEATLYTAMGGKHACGVENGAWQRGRRKMLTPDRCLS